MNKRSVLPTFVSSCVLRVFGIVKGDGSSTSSPRLICCGERDADRGIRKDTYISTRYQQLYHSRYFVWSSTEFSSVDGFGWPVELVVFNRIWVLLLIFLAIVSNACALFVYTRCDQSATRCQSCGLDFIVSLLIYWWYLACLLISMRSGIHSVLYIGSESTRLWHLAWLAPRSLVTCT